MQCKIANPVLTSAVMFVTDHLSFKIEPIRTRGCTKRETFGATYYRYLYSKLVSQHKPVLSHQVPPRLTRAFASTLHCLNHRGGPVTRRGELGTRRGDSPGCTCIDTYRCAFDR